MNSRTVDPLRILSGLVACIFVCMAFASLPGCVGTPQAKQTSYEAFVVAGEARASVITSITLLNDAGFIDEDDYEDIDLAIELTGQALRLWSESLLKGEPSQEAEQKFYESFEVLKGVRDPALYQANQRKPDA